MSTRLEAMVGDVEESDEYDATLAAVAAGDLAALESLYRALRVAVFAVALAIVGERPAAEDVVHDTFVRVYEQAGRYRPGTKARAWVLTIARNLAVDSVRRRSRTVQRATAPAAAGDDPLGTLAWTQALLALHRGEREIVVLHALGGLTHREIAAVTGLPPGTVRWKYRAALRRLRPLLVDGADD